MNKSTPINPFQAIGAILAQGVVHLLERQDLVDNRTEQSVHVGVLTNQENTKHD